VKINLRYEVTSFYYRSPILVHHKTLKTGTYLRVNVFQDGKYISKIDLTPLPQFHQYNVLEWKNIIEQFFSEHEPSFENIILDKLFFNTVSNAEKFSSGCRELHFAIESVLFSLIESLYPEALSFISKKPIVINSLYNSNDDKSSQLPECLKMKIRPGTQNTNTELNLLYEMHLQKPSMTFRLDGNQSFSLMDLKELFNHPLFMKIHDRIEYLEDPLINFNEYALYKKKFTVPMALDESLLTYLTQFSKIDEEAYVILKPSLLGISKSFQLMYYFKSRAVISSTYEFPSAIRPLLYLAALNPHLTHGLDTNKFLPADFSVLQDGFCLPF
jgi:hypothetical protein